MKANRDVTPGYIAMSAVTSGPRHHAGLLPPPPPPSSSSPPPRRDMPGIRSWRGDGILSPDSSRPRRLVSEAEAYEDVWFPLRPAIPPPSRSGHGTEGERHRRRRRSRRHGPEPPTPPASPRDAVEKAPRAFSSCLLPLNPGDPLFPGPPLENDDDDDFTASVAMRPPPRAPMIPRLRTPDYLDDDENDDDYDAAVGCVGFCSCCGPTDRKRRFGGGDRGEKMAIQCKLYWKFIHPFPPGREMSQVGSIHIQTPKADRYRDST